MVGFAPVWNGPRVASPLRTAFAPTVLSSAVVLCVLACGPSEGLEPDSSAARDAMTPSDAGHFPDATGLADAGGLTDAASLEAGALMDAAGLDAGVADASESIPDAGPPPPAIVFVDGMDGDDDRDGLTPATSVRTLQRAIDLAAECLPEPCEVHATVAEYTQRVQLRSHVSVRGGYGADFSAVVGRSLVRFPTEDEWAFTQVLATLNAIDVTGVQLSGLEVVAPTLSGVASTQASSSSALVARRSQLHVADSVLHGGRGRDGADGAVGSPPPESCRGGSGGTGARDRRDGCNHPYSGGGVIPGGDNGPAGRSSCTTDHCPVPERTCDAGGRGGDGASGARGDDGWSSLAQWGAVIVDGLDWSLGSSASGNGENGENGDGGGGGGGGGDLYVGWCLCPHALAQGGDGGNAGEGGCGGGGGAGGWRGGPSMVVMLDASALTFGADVTLIGGRGGDGGAGGRGAAGRAGRSGQPGGSPETVSCLGVSRSACRGGAGGNGGRGGEGGNGGDGAGGPAVNIVLFGVASHTGPVVHVLGTGGVGAGSAVNGGVAATRAY